MADKDIEDHIRKARDLMDLADRKFLLGHDLEGSAMIWESVEQVVTAVAKQRGWKTDGPGDLRAVAERLSIESEDPLIHTGFMAVEIFRHNADLGFMEDFQITHDRVSARRYIRRVAEQLTDKIVFI